MTTHLFQRTSVGAAVILGLCLLGSRPVEASHRVKCEGERDGDLFADEYEGCDSSGEWHVSVKIDTGEFNFHYHADTLDETCFGEHGDIYLWCPSWVGDVLLECDIEIVFEEKTHYHIDHHGHVFLKCVGYALLPELE